MKAIIIPTLLDIRNPDIQKKLMDSIYEVITHEDLTKNENITGAIVQLVDPPLELVLSITPDNKIKVIDNLLSKLEADEEYEKMAILRDIKTSIN